jgi:uncharacterized protein YdhG (YjbR/CyaY superfamily)
MTHTDSDLPTDLSAPARRALAQAGYTQLAQLARRREAEIGELHGMGPKALDRLRRALAAKGLSFAETEVPSRDVGEQRAPTAATAPETVDDYLRGLPADVREALQGLRQAIKEAAPDAVETISYQVPMFKQAGPLVSFGAAKKHCGFYVMSPSLVASLHDELEPYDVAGATIRFTPDAPLPRALVARIVRARIEENTTRK